MLERRRHPNGWMGIALVMLLAACEPVPPPTPVAEQVARPALILQVGVTAADDGLRLPGRVRAAKRAELSFDVPGFVDRFDLEEGRQVKADEIVARLDDRVYQARLDGARAQFERAKTDFARYQQLWDEKRAVPRTAVDERRAKFEAARTNLASAERDLADTLIKAPFDGVITRRHIEPFTNVQAKQPIAELQDLRALEVVVNVPERLVRRLQPQQDAVAYLEGDAHEAMPAMPAIPLTLKSFAAEADPLTQTYPVVLSVLALPQDQNLLPGMAVTVRPKADSQAAPNPATRSAPLIRIPLTAVSADALGQPGVWVVDEHGRVTRRAIQAGPIRGADLTVESGLAAGERIVAAGVHALREGMHVRPLDTR